MDADDFDDYWVQSPKGEPTPTTQALQIDTIDCMKPLDEQFGVAVLKTVPDALYEPLFGQPDDTPLHTYAILDAAKVPNLPELLEVSGLAHRCLFKGDAYDELKDVAPWVVQLEDGNGFTRGLFTRSDAPWHLWDAEAGIFIRSGGTLDDIWRHFRKFTKVQNEQGKWFYFRFWEAIFLAGLLKNGSLQTVNRLLSIGTVLICNPKRQKAKTFRSAPSAHQTPIAAFALQQVDFDALSNVSIRKFSHRLSKWMIATYNGTPQPREMDEIAYQGILRARTLLGLTDERSVADYVTLSWLANQPAEKRFDLSQRAHIKTTLSALRNDVGHTRLISTKV